MSLEKVGALPLLTVIGRQGSRNVETPHPEHVQSRSRRTSARPPFPSSILIPATTHYMATTPPHTTDTGMAAVYANKQALRKGMLRTLRGLSEEQLAGQCACTFTSDVPTLLTQLNSPRRRQTTPRCAILCKSAHRRVLPQHGQGRAAHSRDCKGDSVVYVTSRGELGWWLMSTPCSWQGALHSVPASIGVKVWRRDTAHGHAAAVQHGGP